MKCKIIEDLLPLYTEKMCSEDTMTEVDEHLKGCENCRKKAEAYSVQVEDALKKEADEVKVDEEVPRKALRKVGRKVRRNRIRVILLSLALFLILGILGVLSYGQFARTDGSISFDTVAESIRVLGIVNDLKKGDVSTLIHRTYFGSDANWILFFSRNKEYLADREASLKESWNRNLKGREIKLKKIKAYNIGVYVENNLAIPSAIEINVDLTVDDIPFTMSFYSYSRGTYAYQFEIGSFFSNPNAFEEYQYDQRLEEFALESNNTLSDASWVNLFFVDAVLKGRYRDLKSGEMSIEELIERGFPTIGQRFLADVSLPANDEANKVYCDAFTERLIQIYENNGYFTNVVGGYTDYDSESGHLKQQISIFLEDQVNGEILVYTADFEVGDSGFKLMEGTEFIVDGGVSDELRRRMEELFR